MKKPLFNLSPGSTIFAVVLLGFSGTAFTQDFSREGRFGDWQRRENHQRFALGVCVGQTLAQEQVILPISQDGQPAALDASEVSAIQAAIRSCRAQMDGGGASPSPSPSPTQIPNPAPSPVPSQSSAPSPLPSASGTGGSPAPSPAPSPVSSTG